MLVVSVLQWTPGTGLGVDTSHLSLLLLLSQSYQSVILPFKMIRLWYKVDLSVWSCRPCSIVALQLWPKLSTQFPSGSQLVSPSISPPQHAIQEPAQRFVQSEMHQEIQGQEWRRTNWTSGSFRFCKILRKCLIIIYLSSINIISRRIQNGIWPRKSSGTWRRYSWCSTLTWTACWLLSRCSKPSVFLASEDQVLATSLSPLLNINLLQRRKYWNRLNKSLKITKTILLSSTNFSNL